MKGDSFNTGYGYGVYLTDTRIIGLSYKKRFSHAYYPGYLAGLCFGISLTLVIVYAKFSGLSSNEQIPYAIVWAPVVFGSAASTLIFIFLRPAQVAKKIMEQAPKSLLNLASETPDVMVERSNISQVTVETYRVNVLTKSGNWYVFMVTDDPRLYSDPTKWTGQSAELLSLFKRFCSLESPITMWMRQFGRWEVVTGPDIRFPA